MAESGIILFYLFVNFFWTFLSTQSLDQGVQPSLAPAVAGFFEPAYITALERNIDNAVDIQAGE